MQGFRGTEWYFKANVQFIPLLKPLEIPCELPCVVHWGVSLPSATKNQTLNLLWCSSFKSVSQISEYFWKCCCKVDCRVCHGSRGTGKSTWNSRFVFAVFPLLSGVCFWGSIPQTGTWAVKHLRSCSSYISFCWHRQKADTAEDQSQKNAAKTLWKFAS